ncbi:hypothetical protein PR202_ga14930 [Eleusine coracana subsp. coracana]|uniref:Uncharacterized protein n=1 Tax=Eleusine coracana subsp. coracana TaxID=191504 RepID=A0AAV5CHQ9_ELECO|nr:hypothetical protein PR202_ga14930 [Eleusine coracana subsp. coracana]
MYAKLEEWLGRKVDEYWDTKYDNLELALIQILFRRNVLFCNMPPFNGKCEVPEQQMGRGVVVIGEKRTGYDEQKIDAQLGEASKKEMRSNYPETQDKGDVKVTRNLKHII